MRKDTKLFKILKFLYLNQDRNVSSNEIAKATGVEPKQITPFTNRLSDYVKKEKIGRLYHYKIHSYDLNYIKKVLKNAS